MNGLATQSDFGTAEMGELAVMSMLRAYLYGGLSSVTVGNIPQVPLVTVTAPTVTSQFNSPSSIDVSWTYAWTRWDGQPYTESYPSGFTESTPLVFNVKYSNDGGNTWHFAQDGSSAEAGVVDADAAYAAISPFTWNTSGFPSGTYILRVEGYRRDYPLHYTYDQVAVYIQP
jgi:hypothetical protein